MEIKEIYIKNFRNIGEEGAEIKLSPITIFTGCNSAGKSTAAKALLLLEAYLSDLKTNNYNLIDTPLDFSKVVKLGSFDTVLNSIAKSNGQDYFVLGYSFASAILVADINVRLTFGKKVSDALNNAWLKELSILIDSTELLSIKIIDRHYYFDIKDKEKFIEYIRYYKIRHIVSNSLLYDHSKRENEELKHMLQINPQSIEDDWIAVRIYIPEIRNIERQLVSDEIIRSRLYYRRRDNSFKKIPSVADIISAIENILKFEDIWGQAYEIEKSSGRRLTASDVQRLVAPGIQNLKNIFENLKVKDKYEKCDLVDSMCEQGSSALLTYVNSDYESIIEYKRAKNISDLDDFINKINDIEFQSWVSSYTASNEKDRGVISVVSENVCKGIDNICKYLLEQSLNPYLLGRVGYVDASTVEVKRIYSLDHTDCFGNLWKRFNDEKQCVHWSNDIEKGDFMRAWLREFNICDDIKIENIEGALLIKLISDNMPEGQLLADFGYGVTQLISLLLNIEIAINQAEYVYPDHLVDEDVDLHLVNDPYLLVIEEPEVHLHPSLQSRLADLFLDAKKHGVHFLVETHSEYMVRRSQVIVASIFDKNPQYIPSFRVYYFPNDGLPYDMRYKSNGHFKESFGEGFFDEAGKWSRELMRSKKK